MDNQEKFTYYAFISYQRKDEKWAKWLQRKLENYKLPVANAKNSSENKSKYIRPVFRDKTDLTAGSLPDALKEALAQSRYLIVICSPNAVESPWVNEEIDTFTNAGRTEYIIPFIVDGEPYSKENIKECFPEAIRTIPKEKEPLGVNVKDGGRNQAFIRTVAYMLGVKFDELWNRYERHRKKIRNFSIACLSILMLLAIGLSDYLRTKVEYYADWVDCYGVAQGVTPLDIEQVRHRNSSYKFEYKRIPFGEKGFYSWRLKRVSLVNSKGVISNSTPDNHAFFYPVQEYKYTDGYLTEIINSDSYNRVTMRYTIKDDYEHNVACLVDIEGKEKHQGSAFLSSSTTALLSGENSSSTMSKIKRFHYTRDDKGHIIKVTYHANDAEELDESAIGDNNNIYGKLFELDSLGRVRKVSYINHEGEPMTDKFGVGHIQYSYGQFGGRDTIEYLGADRNLAYNEQKFARRITLLDQYGNSVEECFNGVDGQPCFNYQNIYHTVVKYDKNGNMVELRYYDFDGMPSYCSDNFSIQRANYDSKGRWVEVFHYDVNDVPCYTKNNYSIARVKYNTRDCIIERRVYDINDDPCLEMATGLHMTQIKYDSYNYETEFRFYNEFGKLMVSPILHWAKSSNTYNDYHQVISVKYFDEKGTLCFSNEFVCEIQLYFDSRGNLIKEECYDAEGRPCISKEGYATLKIKYDNYGNRIEESYFGVNGEPIYINMCSLIQFDYYNNGLLKESRYYDTDGKLCLNNDWYAIERLEYDTNGNITKASYFDSDSQPCYIKGSIYSVDERMYDDNSNIIENRFYDKNGELFMNAENYAIGRYTYNDKRQIILSRYFDNNDNPTTTINHIHSVAATYDNRGLLLSQEYRDMHGNRCVNKDGYSKVLKSYDKHGLLSEESYFDSYDKPIEGRNLAFKTIYEYNQYGRLLSKKHIDANGNPVWQLSPETKGYQECFIEYEYDKYGNVETISYKDPNGNATDFAGWSICSKKYDELSREIEIRYFDSSGQPIGGQFNYPIERYSYGNNYQKLSLYYNDTSLVVNVHCFFDKGHITRLTFTDKEDKPVIKYIQGICETPCASRLGEFDEKGNCAKIIYLDKDGTLFNTQAGYAYETKSFDEKGRLVEWNLYDIDNKLSDDVVMNSSTGVNKYDIYGNLIEQSYYDKDGNLANTPWTWSRRLQSYNEKGQAQSDTYYLPDGSIDTYKRNENGEFESKDNLEELPESERTIVILQVENYGQMFELGFHGVYVILEYNEWNTNQGIDSFALVLLKSKGKKKHLVLLPLGDKLGDEDVVECTFSEDALSARIMDNISSDGENRRIAIKKYEEWKRDKK